MELSFENTAHEKKKHVHTNCNYFKNIYTKYIKSNVIILIYKVYMHYKKH